MLSRAAPALLYSVFLLSPAVPARAPRASTKDPAGNTGGVGIQIKNVNMLLTSDIILGVRTLRGTLTRVKSGVPVTFDDSASFLVDVDSAEIHVTAASLTALMNEYVFNFQGAPVKKVSCKFEDGRMVQTGTMHKKIDIPFKIEASVSVTDDGKVRVHAEKIKAEHLPVKGLLHFLGEDLEKLIHDNPGRGVEVDKDDLILLPIALTPPPHMQGRVKTVTIEGDSMILTFDSGRHPAPLNPPFHTAAYIYHRGGVLRFGKLTMADADLEIVGDRPGTFNFFQREYKKQLVAGYSKNTQANGLVSHMVDYSHFQSGQPHREESAGTK
jgi:hypothetical protein